MLRPLRSSPTTWPIVLLALAGGLLECLALWRCRLQDQLGGRMRTRRGG